MNTDAQKKEEEYQKLLAAHAREHKVGHTGKTARKKAAGGASRKWGRRKAHEGWMQAVANNPNQSHEHPL